jgi:glycosyltransferase involved in cell wall biosynthesis
MPKVSIILPVYNGEEFLRQAINSVLLQSFADWEMIIINDGSSDTSGSIIGSFVSKDSRIRQIVHERNLGLVASLNEGVAVSSGEYLARLDSDDFWSDPDKLARQAAYLDNNPQCGLVGTRAEMVDMAGKHLYDFKPPSDDKNIRKQILLRNCFIHSSILIRKNILQQAGGYRVEDRHVEDYSLWLRMGKLAGFANLPEVSVVYRKNPSGITRTKNREQVRAALQLVEKFKNEYPGIWLARIKWRIQSLFV